MPATEELTKQEQHAIIEEQLREVLAHPELFPTEQIQSLIGDLENIKRLEAIEDARDNFLSFVHGSWPEFKQGRHDLEIADAFEAVERGDIRLVVVSMPPRFGKSEKASIRYPAWFIGRNPGKKIIQISFDETLATGFGSKLKELIASPYFKSIFPKVSLSADSRAKGQWNTSKGGQYFACGVGSNIAGHGADLMIIDDPHPDKMSQIRPEHLENAYQSYVAWKMRLQPGAGIIILHTRWGKNDLIGRVKAEAASNNTPIRVVEVPALRSDGESSFPEYWPTERLVEVKNTMSYAGRLDLWNACYMQAPTSDLNSIVKRTAWKPWDKPKPPDCHYKVQVWDTAMTAGPRSNKSACTTWGVFFVKDAEGKESAEVILLNSFTKKLLFPDLKQAAKDMCKQWKPDNVLVEAKTSGPALQQELAFAGLFITPENVKGDKKSRLAAVSDIFEQGAVWYIDDEGNRETIEQVASFPNGDFDDLVDTVSMALKKIRDGQFVKIKSDWTEPIDKRARQPMEYY